MENYDYDRGLDPYVDITEEDEGTPPVWLLCILTGFVLVCSLFGILFGRD